MQIGAEKNVSFFPHIIPRLYRMSADFPSKALCLYRVSPARKRQEIIRLKLTSVHAALNVQEVKSNILHLWSCLCSCFVPVRSAGSQQQQPCERSRQQTEDAQVQLKQSPHLSFPSLLLPFSITHEEEKMTITSRQSFNVLTVIFLLLSTAGL